MNSLRLGPLLRYVDATAATVWVETEVAAQVTVTAGEHGASRSTFAAHGHHYAVVDLVGLPAGAKLEYVVEVNGERVWPPDDSPYPRSVIATIEPTKPLRMAFGSCRVSVPHDEPATEKHGVDALRSYALFMAGKTTSTSTDNERWPDLVLFLGDQVYADETSDAMQEFIATRRSLDEPPGRELKDFEEYAHLYWLAWTEPANRWLLSTVPTAMIFDDHDIRDDWNTSWTWRQQIESKEWWHDRIVGGLGSYWIYQHLGNLAPQDRTRDALWAKIDAHEGPDELDITAELDSFAERADEEPDHYRWSYRRHYGDQARVVVVDSRAARVVRPDERSLLGPNETSWLDEQMRGDVDHLIIGTSLPFLMAPALHQFEAFNEALAEGAWGRLVSRVAERLRQAADMEHWAAFQRAFRTMAAMTLEVASGARGRAPATITFLSGDVHHSYVAEATIDAKVGTAAGPPQLDSTIVQAVCSPIRNPLPKVMQRVTAAATRPSVAAIGRGLARAAGVHSSPLRWKVAQGPWYDNNLAVLELSGDRMRIWWTAGEVVDGHYDEPRLRRVATYDTEG